MKFEQTFAIEIAVSHQFAIDSKSISIDLIQRIRYKFQ